MSVRTFVIPFYYGSGIVLITVPVPLRSIIKLRFRFRYGKKSRFLRFRFRFRNTVECTYDLFQVESARLQLAALRRNNYKTGQDGVTL
jgi:hypothetical protein